MPKHRRDMLSVCDLLYKCGYSKSMSGNALAYDFNLLSLHRTFLCDWQFWLQTLAASIANTYLTIQVGKS